MTLNDAIVFQLGDGPLSLRELERTLIPGFDRGTVTRDYLTQTVSAAVDSLLASRQIVDAGIVEGERKFGLTA